MLKKTGILLAAMLASSSFAAADQLDTYKQQYCTAFERLILSSVNDRYGNVPLEDALEGVSNHKAQNLIIDIYRRDLPEDEEGMVALYSIVTSQAEVACWEYLAERYP